jgi:transposase
MFSKISNLSFDEQLYVSYFHKHQEEYIRKKLKAVKMYSEGYKISKLSSILGITDKTARIYIKTYLSGGFELLCEKITRPKKEYLTEIQRSSLKELIITKSPFEVGLEGNIWTGKIMRLYLKKTHNVEYKTGIYDLLERLNLSHQKSHSDYGNADKEAQKSYLQDLEKSCLTDEKEVAVVKYDEFSICEKPTSYYSWAEKNIRPTHKTDEKKTQD